MTGRRVSPAAAELSSWGATFSCYTAALAAWLAGRQDRWWRPLLAGGPILAITPAADGLLRFEHHPRPLLETLRLTAAHADNWTAAHAAHHAELAEHGALIVCGDVYNLPWQRGHRHWHAPHWFTIIRHDRRLMIFDPLAMNTPAGPQRPSQVPVDPAQIALWSSAPPSYAPAHRLRELSMAGYEPPGPGARYRWLESGWTLRTGQYDPGRLGDPRRLGDPGRQYDPGRLGDSDAVNALAARFRAARHDDPIHHQADDLWQALRQRELLIAAAQVDPGLVHPAALDHWRRAVVGWRRIPPALMHARLRGQAGLPIDRDGLADALLAVAAFEGRYQLTDETVAARPGIADGTRDN